MSDDPFAAFKENAPPTKLEETIKPAKNGRKKRKIPPKKSAAAPTPAKPTADTSKPKRERKVRAPRLRRPVMIPIAFLPDLGGLSAEDTSRLMSFIGNMHDLPKKSRRRIAEVLSKIFS